MAIVVLEHSADAGSDRLGETLRNFGHRLRVIRPHEGEPLPPDLDDVDGVISCGGEGSANDAGVDWIESELDYLRLAHESGRPVLGICLGSQLLGKALGGTVAHLDGAPEIGWHPIKLTHVGREDPLHAGIAWSFTAAHWHREEVTELPPGARLLASSERCKVQAWAVGLRTYGFQYHPEVYADTMETWARNDPDAMQECGLSVEQLRQQGAEHYEMFRRLTQRTFDAVAMLLMPIDRRYEGVLKDLHH